MNQASSTGDVIEYHLKLGKRGFKKPDGLAITVA